MFLKPYLFYSTIFLLFSEALQVPVGFDLRFSYFFILLNLALIVTMYPQRIVFNKTHLTVILYLCLTGLFSVVTGTNLIRYFAEQIVGITISSVYFFLFFKVFSDRKASDIFIAYCRVSLIIIIIGFIKLFLQAALPGVLHPNYLRFESIFTEPSHCITVLMPSIYYYLKKGTKLEAFLCFAALILTVSSVGYMAFAVLVLINSKVKFKQIALTTIPAVALFFAAYFYIPMFTVRIDDTITSIVKRDVSSVNLSTYALVSNMFVAVKSFISDPLLGHGLGSHQLSHARYIGSVVGIESFQDDMDINAKDANSLFLRLLSDLGLMGLIGVFYFIKKHYATKDQLQSVLTKGIFLYFFCKLLREGHYFTPEMYFFVFLYYFNAKSNYEEQAAVPQYNTALNS